MRYFVRPATGSRVAILARSAGQAARLAAHSDTGEAEIEVWEPVTGCSFAVQPGDATHGETLALLRHARDVLGEGGGFGPIVDEGCPVQARAAELGLPIVRVGS